MRGKPLVSDVRTQGPHFWTPSKTETIADELTLYGELASDYSEPLVFEKNLNGANEELATLVGAGVEYARGVLQSALAQMGDEVEPDKVAYMLNYVSGAGVHGSFHPPLALWVPSNKYWRAFPLSINVSEYQDLLLNRGENYQQIDTDEPGGILSLFVTARILP